MLRYLARESRLPVPAVEGASDCLLLLEYLQNGGSLSAASEAEAADHIAALHGHSAPAFGFKQDTLIGPLRQPNPWSETWIPFFRDQRLLYMGELAHKSGNLPPKTYDQLEKLSAKLEEYLLEPEAPALLHGDLWGGNILVRDGRPLAYIDPAIYYGHPEVELAFGTLFGTLGSRFFTRYRELAPLAPGFFEERRDLYNLYPLLVHTVLFGGSYAESVARTLARYL
jgi:fructosamine-3-kinase